MNSDELLKKRFLELAERAYTSNAYAYTGFLGMREQAVLLQMLPELSYAGCRLFGGNPSAERRLAVFGSEEAFGYPPEIPIRLLQIAPCAEKYADALTHRDYLGALLNLGIERSVLGDIVCRPPLAYVYCLDSIVPFLTRELIAVKHTPVSCAESDLALTDIRPVLSEVRLIVASLRADAVVSGLTRLSRSKALTLFAAGKIFINGREIHQSSAQLKTGNVLVIRGLGKFRFDGAEGKTRKERLPIVLQQYL